MSVVYFEKVLSTCSKQICRSFNLNQVRKGDTIAEFLRSVQQQLASEFREIRTASVENLLYIKEDLIIPHVSFFTKICASDAKKNIILSKLVILII